MSIFDHFKPRHPRIQEALALFGIAFGLALGFVLFFFLRMSVVAAICFIASLLCVAAGKDAVGKFYREKTKD